MLLRKLFASQKYLPAVAPRPGNIEAALNPLVLLCHGRG